MSSIAATNEYSHKAAFCCVDEYWLNIYTSIVICGTKIKYKLITALLDKSIFLRKSKKITRSNSIAIRKYVIRLDIPHLPLIHHTEYLIFSINYTILANNCMIKLKFFISFSSDRLMLLELQSLIIFFNLNF